MLEKTAKSSDRLQDQTSESRQFSDFYQKYAPKLFELANKNLSTKLRKQIEPDDILQSVFRSFFSRYRDEIETIPSNELWKLLITLTLNKIRRQARFHSAAKRNSSQGIETEITHHSIEAIDYREPSTSDLVAMCDELVWLSRQLNADQRKCLELRLKGFDTFEIAHELLTTDRTIRRWLQGIRDLLTFREAKYKDGKSFGILKEERPRLEWPTGCNVVDYREFVLEQLIGTGSMCKAYRARRISNQEHVCLKILRQQWRDRPDFQQQFLNEAQVLQGISHTAIVPIIGIGQMPGGSLFMVMKWVHGSSLAQAIYQKRISNERFQKIMSHVQQSMTEIHDQGMSHGDLHAGNILIDEHDKAWVTDFSFARLETIQSKHEQRIKTDWMSFEEMKKEFKKNSS